MPHAGLKFTMYLRAVTLNFSPNFLLLPGDEISGVSPPTPGLFGTDFEPGIHAFWASTL